MAPHSHAAGAFGAGVLALGLSGCMHTPEPADYAASNNVVSPQPAASATAANSPAPPPAAPRMIRSLIPSVRTLTLPPPSLAKFEEYKNEIAAHPAVLDRVRIAQRVEQSRDMMLTIKVLEEALRGMSEEDADSFERAWARVSQMFASTAVTAAAPQGAGGGGPRPRPPAVPSTESERFAFPWPPPEPVATVTFRDGGELDRSWLGNDDTPLSVVEGRLRNALQATAEGFESGIFPLPTGIAILTRYERIKSDGAPLPGLARWPGNSQLAAKWPSWMFVEKPGFYRKIVFAITTEPKIEWGNASRLPEPKDGEPNVPAALREAKFKDYHVHVLVYAFEVRGKEMREFPPVSALEHVKKAGLAAALVSRKPS